MHCVVFFYCPKDNMPKGLTKIHSFSKLLILSVIISLIAVSVFAAKHENMDFEELAGVGTLKYIDWSGEDEEPEALDALIAESKLFMPIWREGTPDTRSYIYIFFDLPYEQDRIMIDSGDISEVDTCITDKFIEIGLGDQKDYWATNGNCRIDVTLPADVVDKYLSLLGVE